ncbi:DNA primase [Chryseobacterium bernardetii]|jgi:DNA primase|uniref:DNA primase n=3 Tax=Chryseobacterium TaxID=59732 RepID=A0A543EG55_9FLAO|nr:MULTISPECIES: DNA primase [Chryseobacterium]MDR6370606.1 DNA primase [Chryseobacterium vietnamense]MDR6441612.1 DNA primase [Chryseobacterium bernardetii]MDR6457054.1 DNA primase [Chryseobacterium vietnamense]MDR6485809.1 DNA primase [Chryseobacterium vietnamense]TQM20564.1 DNA primase [Chryseobacterium aquifrigidense]
MISKQTIDKIFSTIRVEEIVGEYVQLKRAGSNYKGLSPFHEEKSPSFVVSPSKQIWKDFSTGKGGTAISFLMEIENFTYPEALRHAAKKYGIEIEEDLREISEEAKHAQTEKDLLYKIHEVANTYFQEILWDDQEGRSIGLSYFKERELRDDIIKKFQLGYSPEKKNAFTAYALEKGYNKEILEKSGLSIFPENTPAGVDRFRERVIFPIHSFSGRVLGFGARILKNNVKTAKYLNSPETEIYHKSNVLYGLNQSKQAISRKNACLLVEGYMDVISLHMSGIENVVASSGTSLTTEQIKLIKRLTENVTILFDGDNAGIKASFRSIDMLLTEGMNIRVLLFPDGDDPDSFARKHPQDYVEKYIENEAMDFIDFKAEILLKDIGNDPIKKAEAIRDIVKSVSFVQNALKREVYLKEVSNKFGLSEQSLFNELDVQKQITQNQTHHVQQQQKEKAAAPKMEIVPLDQEKEDPFLYDVLFMENKLVDHMLMFGDIILKRRNDQNEEYDITVIEEILHHFEEEQYTFLVKENEIIINQVREGIQKDELRSGNFFVSFMDEEITTKVVDALIPLDELENWASRNIYPPNYGDKVADQIQGDVLLHKYRYIDYLIRETAKELDQYSSTDEVKYYELIKKITLLKQASMRLSNIIEYSPIKGIYVDRKR